MRTPTVRRSVVLLAALGLFAGVAGAQPASPPPAAEKPATPPPADKPAAPAAPTPGAAKPAETTPETTKERFVYITLTTSKGDIVLELDRDRAPISTKNFSDYVERGHYDNTIFHRVIPGFMVQGGGFTPDMNQKPTAAPIKNEFTNGLKNMRGTIAMARTSDPDSASAQFFINVADNGALDQASPRTGNAGYAVFGKVVKGMDVVDAIVKVPTATKGQHGNVPVDPITITKATKLSDSEAAAFKKK